LIREFVFNYYQIGAFYFKLKHRKNLHSDHTIIGFI